MALQGYARLELAREKKINGRIEREVVKRVEKHNTISPYVETCVKQGNMWYMLKNTSIYPKEDKFFGGCLLTDRPNPDGNSVSGFFGMIGSDANITAQCSNDAYNGNNSRRGNYNSNESGIITNGYRHVFDWGTDRGNGTIAGIALCKPQIARADFSKVTSHIPEDDSFINENFGYIYNNVDGITVDNAFLNMDVVDYEGEKGFSVAYSNGTITVNEYDLNTKIDHIIGATGGVRSSSSHTISQVVSNYSNDRSTATVVYVSDHIHLLTFSGSTLNDYDISTADWSCTATSHTFSGVSFTTFRGSTALDLVTAGMLIKDGYLYAISGNQGQKIVKCNLSNDADITEFDNPVYSVAGLTKWGNGGDHGSFVLLPNGDFYIIDWNIQNANAPCVYFHNNEFYYCKRYQARLQKSIYSNTYGTVAGISTIAGGGRSLSLFLETMFPWVSTVANIEPVIKSADLTLKLTYEIVEVVS